MPPVLKSRYGQTAICLVVAFGVGRYVWGWGFIMAAFGLLVYLILAIGIRLDDMAQDIRVIRDARTAEAAGNARLVDHLAALNATLTRIDRHLAPTESPPATDDVSAVKMVRRD